MRYGRKEQGEARMAEEQICAMPKTDIAALYHKINGLRADLMTRDWTDDKFMQIGSGGFRFLSTDKMLKTVSPLIAMHGLDLRVEIKEVSQRDALERMPQHWTIRADVSLIDIDTGCADTCTVYAEAADNGDKALRKAHTMAIKQWMLSKFLIADGIDELYVEGQEKKFRPRTEEEQEEAKSKVLSLGEKPSAPAPSEPRKAPVKAEKVPEPKKEEKAAPKAEKPAETPEAAPVKAEAPKSNGSGMFINGIEVNGAVAALSKPQYNMIEKALTGKMTLHDGGMMDDDEYERMLKHLSAIETKNDAMSFIRMYRE